MAILRWSWLLVLAAISCSPHSIRPLDPRRPFGLVSEDTGNYIDEEIDQSWVPSVGAEEIGDKLVFTSCKPRSTVRHGVTYRSWLETMRLASVTLFDNDEFVRETEWAADGKLTNQSWNEGGQRHQRTEPPWLWGLRDWKRNVATLRRNKTIVDPKCLTPAFGQLSREVS